MRTSPLGDVLAALTRRALATTQAPSARELQLIDQIVQKTQSSAGTKRGQPT